jgi:hypothetical protein
MGFFEAPSSLPEVGVEREIDPLGRGNLQKIPVKGLPGGRNLPTGPTTQLAWYFLRCPSGYSIR